VVDLKVTAENVMSQQDMPHSVLNYEGRRIIMVSTVTNSHNF